MINSSRGDVDETTPGELRRVAEWELDKAFFRRIKKCLISRVYTAIARLLLDPATRFGCIPLTVVYPEDNGMQPPSK